MGIGKISGASPPERSAVQAELVMGVSLGRKGGKDVLDRSNNISKVVRKENTS